MRTFIACHVGKTKEIDGFIMEIGSKGVTPVRTPELHITLHFFGETSLETAERITVALKKIHFQKFRIDMTGIGFFPSGTRPRVAYINVVGFPHVLYTQLMGAIGQKHESEFIPHITVARIHGNIDVTGLVKKYGKFHFGSAGINELCYYKSELRPTGPVYTIIESVQLI